MNEYFTNIQHTTIPHLNQTNNLPIEISSSENNIHNQEIKSEENLLNRHTVTGLFTNESHSILNETIENKLNMVVISDSDEEMNEEEYKNEKKRIEKFENDDDNEDMNSYLPSKHETLQIKEPEIIQLNSKSKVVLFGNIETILEGNILLKPMFSLKIYDLDTTIYDSSLNPIGFIFDLIGQIDDPLYIIHPFQQSELYIKSLKEGDQLMIDENNERIVNTKELIEKSKATDASNVFDEEVDDMEFSDDEKEIQYKRSKKNKNKIYKEDKHMNQNNINGNISNTQYQYQYNKENVNLKPSFVDPFSMFVDMNNK